MERITSLRIRFRDNRKGFSLAEIAVMLFVISLAAVLIAGLAKQVGNLSKTARQTSAILELRSRGVAFTKNPQKWLDQMRGKEAIYAGCIPPSGSAASSIDCPPVSDALKTELGTHATGYHVASAPIYDEVGTKIAGDVDHPVLLTNDGLPCVNDSDFTCTLKSTGYFLRTNPDLDANPGSIKFLMKVEKRPDRMGDGALAMKAQVIPMNVGADWTITNSECGPGSVKMGTQSNGSAHCVPVASSCATGEITVGIKSNGAPKCAVLPNCAQGQFVNMGANGTLSCTTSSTPCPTGSAHLGFYSGTQTPICSTALAGCPSGEVQTGLNTNGSSVTPICRGLPTCTAAQKLSYNGTSFTCVSDVSIAAQNCPTDKVVTGVKANGEVICRSLASGSDGEDGEDGVTPKFPVCASGTFLTTNANGKLVCKAPTVAGGRDGVDGGDGIDAVDPSSIGLRATYTVESPNTTSWACKNNIDIRKICSGPDGCYLRFNLQHKQNSDKTLTFETPMYVEQKNVSNNSLKGLFGYVHGQSSFILGDPNRRHQIASPWDWVYILNYKHSHCPGRTNHSAAYDDPFLVTILVHPFVKARITFRN